MDPIIVTLGLMIIIASILALIAQRLQQPLLLGYVIAGVVLGPAITGIVHDPAPLLSFIIELGLIFLLFIIGLELDLSKLQDVGKASAVIGTVQVLLVTLICALAGKVLGFTLVQGIYLGLAISFSSTIVVVKILTEIKEIDSLHGELALGILVIQDILAVISLSILGTLKNGGAESSLLGYLLDFLHVTLPNSGWVATGLLLANLVLFALVTLLFYKYIMPRIFKEAMSSAELLFVTTLAVMLVLSAIAGLFAFSLAMGAFLAGIALSTAPYSYEILGRVKPLKDFFLLLFFVSLGMQLIFENFVNQLSLILFIFIGAVVIKPLVIFFICKLFKYNNRTSFFVSLHLAQVSEFSLIIIASGITQGSMPTSTLTALVIVTILTMVLTEYLIHFDQAIYRIVQPLIAPMDVIFGTRAEEHRNVPANYQPQVVIIGVNPMTAEAIETLHGKKRILVIDYNPRKIISYKERNIPTVCTDALNPELYETIDFSKTETVVSVVHESKSNLFLLKSMHELSKKGHKIAVVVSAATEDNAKRLYRAGATMVLMPDVMGRRLLSEILNTDDPAMIRNIGRVYYDELHKNFVFIREI